MAEGVVTIVVTDPQGRGELYPPAITSVLEAAGYSVTVVGYAGSDKPNPGDRSGWALRAEDMPAASRKQVAEALGYQTAELDRRAAFAARIGNSTEPEAVGWSMLEWMRGLAARASVLLLTQAPKLECCAYAQRDTEAFYSLRQAGWAIDEDTELEGDWVRLVW